MYTTSYEKLKLLVFQNCVEWVSPEWNSYQTVLITRSQLIFKNKGEVWFFLFFYCENTFSVRDTHFKPEKKGFKWVPHTTLIWHRKTPLGKWRCPKLWWRIANWTVAAAVTIKQSQRLWASSCFTLRFNVLSWCYQQRTVHYNQTEYPKFNHYSKPEILKKKHGK